MAATDTSSFLAFCGSAAFLFAYTPKQSENGKHGQKRTQADPVVHRTCPG